MRCLPSRADIDADKVPACSLERLSDATRTLEQFQQSYFSVQWNNLWPSLAAALPTVSADEEEDVLFGDGASTCKVLGKDAKLLLSEAACGECVEESFRFILGWTDDL